MSEKMHRASIIIFLSFVGGIIFSSQTRPAENPTLAVLPFREGAHSRVGDEYICNITGFHFARGKVEPGSARIVTRMVYEYIKKHYTYDVLPLEIAYEAIEEKRNEFFTIYSVSLGSEMGKKLRVDYVVMGVVVRFEEREALKRG